MSLRSAIDERSISDANGQRYGATWDVFVGEHTGGLLWLGWVLAKKLADRGERVRLYSDQIRLLSLRVPGVLEHADLQYVEGLAISRCARAVEAWPATNVVQVQGVRIPSAYLHRLFYRSGESRLLQLESMEGGRATTAPLTHLEDYLGCRSFLVQMGDAPSHSGYLHSPPGSMRYSQYGEAPHDFTRSGWLARLGFKNFGLNERFTVYVDARAGQMLTPLLDHWRSLQFAFRVLLESPEAGILAYSDSIPNRCLLRGASLSATWPEVIGLPLLNWADAELVLRSANLALIGDSVSCIRVASLGIPLLPLLPKPVDDDTLIRWYCEGLTKDVAALLFGLAEWDGGLETLPQLWGGYLESWDAIVTHADRVAVRIRNGLDLADTVLGQACAASPSSRLSD